MTRIAFLEAANLKLTDSLKDTSVVISECVYATQIILEKGIITRDELKAKRHTFAHPHPNPSEGSDLQPEDAGADVHSGGRGQPGISEKPSDRGDPDGGITLQKSASVGWSELSEQPEQSDPAATSREG